MTPEDQLEKNCPRLGAALEKLKQEKGPRFVQLITLGLFAAEVRSSPAFLLTEMLTGKGAGALINRLLEVCQDVMGFEDDELEPAVKTCITALEADSDELRKRLAAKEELERVEQQDDVNGVDDAAAVLAKYTNSF